MSRRRRNREQPAPEAAESQRVDKWLWCVRICKTRADAARLVGRGGVRINRRKVSRPSALVRRDDVLTIALHGRVRVVRVAGFAARRVSPAVAEGLRIDIEEPAGERQI